MKYLKELGRKFVDEMVGRGFFLAMLSPEEGMLDFMQQRRSFLLKRALVLQINMVFGCAPTFLHCVLVAGLAGKARRVASWWDLFYKLDRIDDCANFYLPGRGGSVAYGMRRLRCARSACEKQAQQQYQRCCDSHPRYAHYPVSGGPEAV